MKNNKIFFICILALFFSIVSFISIFVIKNSVEEESITYLNDSAKQAMLRTEHTVRAADAVLGKLNNLSVNDCGIEHRNKLRNTVLGSKFLRSIIYAPNGVVKCSPRSRFSYALPPMDGKHSIGSSFWLNFKEDLPRDFILNGVGPYYAVIDPQYLIDIDSDKNTDLYLELKFGNKVVARSISDKDIKPNHRLQVSLFGINNPKFKISAYLPRKKIDVIFRQRIQSYWWFFALVGVAFLLSLTWIVLRRPTMGDEILSGLDSNEFSVSYQPMIDLENGQSNSAEALLRWQRYDGKRISPDVFIAYAEEHQQITLLSQFVLHRVVADLAKLKDKTMSVSVNLAAADLAVPCFVENLAALCKVYQLDAHRLKLEITERSFVVGPSEIEVLTRLRAAGHLILIDDFGTGYSSLSYLHHLPADILKIDKSFVQALGKAAAPYQVILHIVKMAAALDLAVVAEGVETLEQARILKKMGVKWGQGWLYAKAMPFDELVSGKII